VRQKLLQSYGTIQNVYVFDRLIDTSAAGLNFSQGYFFDESIWIGHQSNLLYIYPSIDRNPYEMQGEDVNRAATQIQYGQFCDFLRPDAELGYVITGVS
jgi:hypothetical protein